MKSVSAIKTGSIGIAGATGILLTQTLEDLRSLNERITLDMLLAAKTDLQADRTPPAGP